MKRFSSISYQLFGFFGWSLLIVGILFYISLSYNTQTRGFLEKIGKETEFLNQVKEARYHFSFARKEEKNWILFKNPNYLESRTKSLTRGQSLLAGLKRRAATPELVEMLESLESHLFHYLSLGDELKGLASQRQIEVFTRKAKLVDEGVMEQVNEITNFLLQRVEETQKTANRAFQSYFRWTIFIVTAGLALFVGAGSLWIYRFRRRLVMLTRASQKMALGDYSPQLDASSSDELGLLASSFNEMAAKVANREEKVVQITQELIQANNLLKKGTTPLHQIPKIGI